MKAQPDQIPKARGDSVLKTLPEERMAAVFEYLQGHTLRETLAWLKADGVVTGLRALSEFFHWWPLHLRFRQNEETTEQVIQELRKAVPELTDEQLDTFGTRTFSVMAIQQQDADAFVRVRSARSKGMIEAEKVALRKKAEERMERALGLQREKFQRETCALFLKWAADGEAKKIAGSKGSNAEKIERLGELMFGEGWK